MLLTMNLMLMNQQYILNKLSLFIYFFNFFLTFIYFSDGERHSMNGGGAEREGNTESEAGSRL